MRKTIRNQKGQGTVEMVLLMAITISITIAVTKFVEEKKFVQKLFGDPWTKLAGMIECGVWDGCASDGRHPASSTRILSLKPKE